ncbi:hypothetical protein ON010_g4819 [Phytophthora cinnamomi]|nr:hypothetical protein ON010_g4819 [Phytophthora cinnamomi]
MDVEYIDEQEPPPICIDEDYYSLPTPKPKVIVESRITLEYFNRITRNTSPAKVYMVEIPSLAQSLA